MDIWTAEKRSDVMSKIRSISWERYLKSERIQVRIGKQGTEASTTEKGMKKGGVSTIMRDLRTLFKSTNIFARFSVRLINPTFPEHFSKKFFRSPFSAKFCLHVIYREN